MKLSVLFFFFVSISFSQNLKGKVLDKETKRPLEHVNIYINKSDIGTATDKNGAYNLKVYSKSTDTISFSIIGYATQRMTISQLKALNFTVYLLKKTEQLNEVLVESEKELKNAVPFKKLAALKKGVYNFGSEIIDSKIYIFGGDKSFIEETEKKILQEVQSMPGASLGELIKRMRANFSFERYTGDIFVYDIAENSWHKSNIALKKRAYHRAIRIQNNLYVLGGKTISKNGKFEYLNNEIEVINLENNEVVIDETNPHQAVNFAAFGYSDNIIIIGGSTKLKKDKTKIYSDNSHMYNTTSGLWYELPKMTKPKEVNGIVVDNIIYLIGGFNGNPLKEIESYDINTGKWKEEGNLFSGIENPALAYSDSTIYIFNDGLILTYDLETRVLNEYKINVYTKGSQMHIYNEQLYIIGGFYEDEFTKSTSSRMIVIDLNDFDNTKIIKSVKFN